MTWQDWIGVVLFYGGLFVLVAATVVFAADGWRNRECGDEIAVGRASRCCLIRKHDGPHRSHGPHGATWERTGERVRITREHPTPPPT